jgi:hypothetical protein
MLVKLNFAPEDVMVFFDFDQTLTQADTQSSGNGGPPKTVSSVRGGKPTLEFIEYMNEKGIRWYVNTARGPGSTAAVAQNMVKQYKLPFSGEKDWIFPGQSSGQKLTPEGLSFVAEEVKHRDSTVGYVRNVISCGYDKEIATDWVLSKQSHLPKLLIFVDDNAKNIDTIWTYMKSERPSMLFYGIVYEPYRSKEKGHIDSLEIMRDLGAYCVPLYVSIDNPYTESIYTDIIKKKRVSHSMRKWNSRDLIEKEIQKQKLIQDDNH